MKKDLPSIRHEEAENRKRELQQQKLKQEQNLRADMVETFQTAAGKRVLKWLRDQCGFGHPVLGAVAGQLDEKATLYNAMRLNLYYDIRKNLPTKLLKEVEYD